jgi:hypothetical protein
VPFLKRALLQYTFLPAVFPFSNSNVSRRNKITRILRSLNEVEHVGKSLSNSIAGEIFNLEQPFYHAKI